MKVVFSSLFNYDLQEAGDYYAAILPRLGNEFQNRVRDTVRTIVDRRGGDHVGPHGFRGRKCHPFPHFVYYQVAGDTLYILALVHERRHPDHLRRIRGG